ncbi:hypothetical protein JTE90_024510 [Oedothorax gibbosus]|uniref:Uncharacterized protein n=1 Tax=Oedothorax gibbosus TaxID=931172 RepID=A0AAV6TNK0_9ARAC|nr:hypothetical protein JTE90_024510 [Oedothorax gibbosus]
MAEIRLGRIYLVGRDALRKLPKRDIQPAKNVSAWSQSLGYHREPPATAEPVLHGQALGESTGICYVLPISFQTNRREQLLGDAFNPGMGKGFLQREMP